jgi:hypothetical protein
MSVPGDVLAEGLRRDGTTSRGCQHGGHVSIAATPEMAAWFVEGCGRVLVVDLDGLPGVGDFYEARRGCTATFRPTGSACMPDPCSCSLAGHVDPGKTWLANHPACVDPSRLDGFDLSTYREEPE